MCDPKMMCRGYEERERVIDSVADQIVDIIRKSDISGGEFHILYKIIRKRIGGSENDALQQSLGR